MSMEAKEPCTVKQAVDRPVLAGAAYGSGGLLQGGRAPGVAPNRKVLNRPAEIISRRPCRQISWRRKDP